MAQLSQTLQIIPLLEPKTGSTAAQLKSDHVKVGAGHWYSFVIPLAAVTGGATLTVECAASSSGAHTALPFSYRISKAVGSVGFDAVQQATASGGAAIGASDDNKIVIAEVDPSRVYAVNPNAKFVRAALTFAASESAVIGGVHAFIEPHYKSA